MKILIADHDTLFRQLLAATLRGREGYEILTAKDGLEAIEVARREHPRLIILDFLLARRDGIETCRTLKSDPVTANIIIMLLTAPGYGLTREHAEAAGADAFVTKPYSPSWLLDQIELFAGSGEAQ